MSTLVVATTLTVAACGSSQVEPLAAPGTAAPERTPDEPEIVFPTPTPTYPLSDFEDDPAVQTLRRYGHAIAQAHNAGDYTLPALLDTVTPEFAPKMTERMQRFAHLVAPGPGPFTPIGVRNEPDARYVYECSPDSGWWFNRETGEREGEWHQDGTIARLVEVDGRWLIDELYDVGDGFDCSDVDVQELPW